jgi:hypothetical protein
MQYGLIFLRRVSGTYPGLMAGGHRPGVALAEPGSCGGGSGYPDTCQQRFAGGSGYLDSSLQRGSGYPDNSLQRLTTALQGLNPAEVERRRRLMAHTHRYPSRGGAEETAHGSHTQVTQQRWSGGDGSWLTHTGIPAEVERRRRLMAHTHR